MGSHKTRGTAVRYIPCLKGGMVICAEDCNRDMHKLDSLKGQPSTIQVAVRTHQTQNTLKQNERRMYARTRTLGTIGSGCNGAGAGGCTTGAAVSSVKSMASPETPACGADGCPAMGAAPDGSCTPTHKQGMDGMGRTPTIMMPGCFAKARRRISKATRCEQP